MKLERRFLSHELRVKKSDDGSKKIVGYAAKYAPNARSEDLGGFVEELHPDCFSKCLVGNVDCRALWNHDANHVLGRTTAGTLKLSTDNVGLHYEIDPPDTQLARDLMVSMERGDVTQASFGFICTNDSWREDPISGQYIRTVLQAELLDISPVTFPAYPDATSGVRQLRSMFPEGNEEIQAKLNEMRAAKTGAATKEVDGAHLTAHDFAYVGDPEKTDTWKLPINFPGDPEKTKSHIQNALARFSQTEGIPDSEKAKVYDKIVAAAKAHGIHVDKETYNSYQLHQAELRTIAAKAELKAAKEALRALRAAPVVPVENREDGQGNDNMDNDCDCDCSACNLDDCENCTNPDCDDENCDRCGMRASRSAAKEADERAAAELETLRLRARFLSLKSKF